MSLCLKTAIACLLSIHLAASRQAAVTLKTADEPVWSKQARAVLHGPWAILSMPLIVVLYPLNFLRIIWADLGYGIAIGILAPLAIFKYLA